ncbi:expressed unknown protein [Seminavis robusta]|uniref:Uncharacterized protein n=1 Tax=Seminavis robusta TaxID=568900 RepID=A0A9N8ER48_9STRA|nr:expressed unknown protein [Seminavis robusta]|eukprot:Sro1650_g288690.1 n/a (269) ;mRNA; f:9475-10281
MMTSFARKWVLLGGIWLLVLLLCPQISHGFTTGLQSFRVQKSLSREVGDGRWVLLNNSANDGDDDDTSTESSRRTFLFQQQGIMTTAMVAAGLVGAPSVANADPSLISSLQGPLQDAIAPGHWIGQFLGINSRQVTWEFSNASPALVSQALVDVLNELSPQDRAKLFLPEFSISRADSSKVHVITWTKNEWLDSLDVSFLQQQSTTTSCIAKASFYATGFLPTSIPGAPLFNIGFAWFPFASPGPRGQMLQDYRLKNLERLVRQKLAS